MSIFVWLRWFFAAWITMLLFGGCRTPQQEAMGFVARLGDNLAAGATWEGLDAGADVTLDDPSYRIQAGQFWEIQANGVTASGRISGKGASDPRLTPAERAALMQALRERQPYEVILQLLREAQANGQQ